MGPIGKIMPSAGPTGCEVLLAVSEPLEAASPCALACRSLLQGLIEQGVAAKATSPHLLGLRAPAWLRAATVAWPTATPDDVRTLVRRWTGPLMPLRLAVSQEQGLPVRMLAGLSRLTQLHQPAAVVACGGTGPLLLAGADRGPVRLWLHTADAGRMTTTLLQGLATRRYVHGVAGLTAPLRRSARLQTLGRRGEATPLALDVDALPPRPMRAAMPPVLVTWGDMHRPAVRRSLAWLIDAVLPALRAREPRMTLVIGTDCPTGWLNEVRGAAGVVVAAEEQVQRMARGGAVAVFPQLDGGRACPALLEAACLALPIVASSSVLSTMIGLQSLTLASTPHRPEMWVEAIWRCWHDPGHAMALSSAARRQIDQHHRRSHAARAIVDLINRHLPAEQAIALQGSGTGAMPLRAGETRHRRAA